jgi:hypothetical protein
VITSLPSGGGDISHPAKKRNAIARAKEPFLKNINYSLLAIALRRPDPNQAYSERGLIYSIDKNKTKEYNFNALTSAGAARAPVKKTTAAAFLFSYLNQHNSSQNPGPVINRINPGAYPHAPAAPGRLKKKNAKGAPREISRRS